MGAFGVVMTTPLIDLLAGMTDGLEPVRVQTVVAQFAVEGFHKGVLNRLARLDEPQPDAGALRPFEHGPTGAFGTVIQDNLLRQSKPQTKIIQETGDTLAGNGNVHDLTGTIPVVIIDDIQDPESAIIAELIGHEIQ